MILILSSSNDRHTNAVTATLKRLGAEYARINLDCPPAESLKTIYFSKHERWTSAVDAEGKNIDLGRVRVVWNRRRPKPSCFSAMSAEDEKFAWNEYKHFLAGLWLLLQDRLWVNGLQSTESAEIKPYQLAVAQSLGLEIPRTAMTNDPSEVFAFFEECQSRGRFIYKTFHPAFRRNDDGIPMGIYTTRVHKEDLLSRRTEICLTPCIFQEYVEKQTELRITVIGNRIFATEINTSNSTRARDDWRRYDDQNTVYRPYSLPDSISALLKKLMVRLNLVFGCIDMVVTPDNRFVFLEINPMGEWLWLEQRTRVPLLAHFTQMLVQGVPAFADPALPAALASFTGEAS